MEADDQLMEEMEVEDSVVSRECIDDLAHAFSKDILTKSGPGAGGSSSVAPALEGGLHRLRCHERGRCPLSSGWQSY